MRWIVAYLLCLACFLVLDGAFITLVARKAYRAELGKLLNDKPKPLPGALFYLIYLAAVLLYGVWPLLTLLHDAPLSSVFWRVVGWGAGLGLLAFGSYALTAKSLVKDWSTKIVLVDILWGMFLTAAVTTVGYAFLR